MPQRMPQSRRIIGHLLFPALLLATPSARAQSPAAPSQGWSDVERALGRTGAMNPGDVIKFSFPRSDMHVRVGDVQLRPALALGSWIAFMNTSGGAIAMGDLVLGEDEVGPVMRKLQEGGVEQTALHNHVLTEQPRVMYMHIFARGDATKIATTIHDALALTKTPMGAPAPPAAAPPIDLDTAMLARVLGVSGKVNGGVYQVSVPRVEHIMEFGMEVPASMGVATAINFQPTGAGSAAITGDFVMIASEVNPVIRALTSHGITVTALHSHMLEESPRLFFMHFWANANSGALAAGLRAALEEMNVKKATVR
jgi:hypothetical protein